MGALGVWYLYPRVRVQYQDRVQVQTKVVTRIVERKRPDGSSETTTEIVDTSKSDQNKVLYMQPKYILGAGITASFPVARPDYEVVAAKRVLGPLFIYTKYNTSGQFGAGVLGEF